jgi:hypothetical protein
MSLPAHYHGYQQADELDIEAMACPAQNSLL